MQRFALVLVIGLLALTQFGLPSASAAAQQQNTNQDQWRYVLHNGEWWYWLPENRWIYWRANQWNNYDPKSFTASNSAAVAQGSQVGPSYGNRASGSDIRPFYGHAGSDFGYQSSGENEIGPFYGHAMPGEVLGGWRARRSGTRPYYGHAVSSGDQ